MNKYTSSRSELVRVGNPFRHNRFVRTEYYTNISFCIDNEFVEITVKVDTGSPYTIIGLNNDSMLPFRDKILPNVVDIELYDATESQVDIEQYNVSNFKLTDDIVFDKLKLCFSNDLNKKSVLGLDILSLFEAKYEFYNKSRSGTLFLLNFTNSINNANKFLDKDGILTPMTVLEFDNFNSSYEDLETKCERLEHELKIQKGINSGLYIVNNKLKELEKNDS